MKVQKYIALGLLIIASNCTIPTVQADEQEVTEPSSVEVQLRSADINFPDSPGKPLGRWEYIYTIEPFAYFKNTKTGAITMVQATSSVNHTVNTMVDGWVTHGPNYNFPYYNPAHRYLLR